MRCLSELRVSLGAPCSFIECGPDDKPSPHKSFEKLHRLCPSVRFIRLGGEEPVSEALKQQALTAADLAISLVDNPRKLSAWRLLKQWRQVCLSLPPIGAGTAILFVMA